MAKFIYRMANVLDIKLKMEDQAKTFFAEALAALNLEEEKLEALNKRLEGYEQEGRAIRERLLNTLDMRDNERAIKNIKEQIDMQMRQVELAKDHVENARARLQEAIQERQIQEKLKENAFEEFKMELNAAESKEVDELVSYRFGVAAAENKNTGS